MRWPFCLLLLVAACGNDLPPPGTCEAEALSPTVTSVDLLGRSTAFDDLRFSPQLGKVLAAPEGEGVLFLADPETLDVTEVAVPRDSASADASADAIYVVDRGGRIIALEVETFEERASYDTDGAPDYVRVAPSTGEVWVTLPGRDRIDILDPIALTRIGTVQLAAPPEGLTFDGRGRAYTHGGTRVITIDVEGRVVVAEAETGCGWSHGFPQADEDYGLVIGGCAGSGGAGVVDDSGDSLAGIEAGGGAAVLAYDSALHRLYLRGDPGDTLDVIAVCPDGGMSVVATVPIPMSGHASTVDDLGNVWVCDAGGGGLVRIAP